MQHYGLVGKRLGHSFSKRYFTEKFKQEAIDAIYTPIEIEEISSIVEILRLDKKMCGFNVTIPYKQSIIKHLDELSPEAEAVGAVNCVDVRDGRTKGYNTDIEGIKLTLDKLNIEPGTQALVLGSGGASRATTYILRQLGIPYMVVSRNEANGDITYDKLTRDIIGSHKLIINATPVGMFPDLDSAPNIDYDAIGPHHKVFDLIYNPSITLFMLQAKERGAHCIGGMPMLERQAEVSWQIWQRDR